MPVTVQQIDANTVRLEVEIPAEQIDTAFERELRRQRGQIRLRGFRPGKAPLSLVRGYIGEQVMADVTGELMQETLLRAVEEHELRAVSAPKVEREPHEPGKPIRFAATFEVHERPREVDLEGLKAERRVAVIDDTMVDDQIQRLRELHARTVPIEPSRPAAKGDVARLDYSIRFDDKPDDPPITREGLEVEVGAGHVLDEIAEALIGMSVGETRQVRLDFPADHRLPTLAGRKGQVEIKLIDLSQRKLPEMDDEFARDVGEADLAALRAKVRAEMEAEARRAADNDLDQALLDQVVERAKPSLPAGWLEEQVKERIGAFQRTFGAGRELGEEELGTFRTEIERQIRRAMVVGWIAKQKDLDATPEQVEKRLVELAERVGKPLPAVKAEFAKKGMASLLAEITEANVHAALRAGAAISDVAADARDEGAGDESGEKADKPAKSAKKSAARKKK